jgi:hypothetical protein
VARLNVYVPDELEAAMREQLPGLNVSAVLREALHGLLRCDHAVVRCCGCSADLRRSALEIAAVAGFWRELAPELERLAWAQGTATGAAAVVWRAAGARGVAVGSPPRPNRADRETNARWRDERETA